MTATGGESFGRSLRRSNDSPEGCGSWTRRSSEPPPRRNLSAASSAGEEGPGSERYGERADLHRASGDAQGELCSPPLHSRRGKSTDEAKRGAHKRARCGASGDIPLMVERNEGLKVYGVTHEKASMTRNRSPQMFSTCSSALCTSSGPRLSAASAWASASE